MPDSPEHDRMKAIKPEADAIAAFLEWLQAEGYSLRTYEARPYEVGDTCLNLHMGQASIDRCTRCDEDGVEVVTRRNEDWHLHPKRGADIQKWLAAFFDIDLDKIEEEKRAMLDELRALNA